MWRCSIRTPVTTIGHYSNDPSSSKRGLRAEEMRRVVKELGCELRIIDFVGDVGADYDQIMHPMLESGFPTILEVQGWNANKREYYAHALSVNGHTLNSDRWTPQATIGYGEFPIMPYIPASSWVCHYIISDDNYGMNVTLPSDMIRNETVPHRDPNLHAQRLLAVLPRKIVDGYIVEEIAMEFATQLILKTKLSRSWFWLEELKRKGFLNH